MKTTDDPTPQQVASRIREVSQLNRLCASLMEAGRLMRERDKAAENPLPPQPMSPPNK
jgi:hypothetical protein